MTQPFLLNERYIVDPVLNNLTDTETGQENRIEQRLMTILCILAESKGKLVTRNHLIAQVWDNYGGADEGLNQAISFIRKALDDKNKEIIETIPKKGYILHASIKPILPEGSIPKEKLKTDRFKISLRTYLITGLILSLLTVFYIIYSRTSESNKSQELNINMSADAIDNKNEPALNNAGSSDSGTDTLPVNRAN